VRSPGEAATVVPGDDRKPPDDRCRLREGAVRDRFVGADDGLLALDAAAEDPDASVLGFLNHRV
jgi:hypothetical protein